VGGGGQKRSRTRRVRGEGCVGYLGGLGGGGKSQSSLAPKREGVNLETKRKRKTLRDVPKHGRSQIRGISSGEKSLISLGKGQPLKHAILRRGPMKGHQVILKKEKEKKYLVGRQEYRGKYPNLKVLLSCLIERLV